MNYFSLIPITKTLFNIKAQKKNGDMSPFDIDYITSIPI